MCTFFYSQYVILLGIRFQDIFGCNIQNQLVLIGQDWENSMRKDPYAPPSLYVWTYIEIIMITTSSCPHNAVVPHTSHARSYMLVQPVMV